MLGEPRTKFLDPWFRDTPSPGPRYAVETADLSLLLSQYLSTRFCVLDFDQAFLANHPPSAVAHIPPPYLAPESIFELTNGPAADIWAFGSILYSLRAPVHLFWDSYLVIRRLPP
jgi:serine/threonine protein kinase